MFFSSKSPNVSVLVNKDFTYRKGEFKEYEHQFHDNENHRIVYIHHTLRSPNENNIDYFHDPEHWIYLTSDDNIDLTRFTKKIHENKWYIQDFVNHASTASCFIARKMSTFTTMHDLLHILYAWEIPPYACSSWTSVRFLNKEQEELIEKFRKSFAEDVTIEKYSFEE